MRTRERQPRDELLGLRHKPYAHGCRFGPGLPTPPPTIHFPTPTALYPLAQGRVAARFAGQEPFSVNQVDADYMHPVCPMTSREP